MFEYQYTRAWLPTVNHFDICYGNLDADPPIIESSLDNEVFLAFGKKFRMCCDGVSCVISFETELSSGEELQLDQLVADHKVQATSQAVFSTTDTGVLEFTTRGPADTGIWVTWESGGTPEWIQHIGTDSDVVTSHDYLGAGGTKEIVFSGALSNVTSFTCSDISFGGDVGNFGVMTGLTYLDLTGTSIGGDIAGMSTLVNVQYLYMPSTNITGNIDALGTMTSLIAINMTITAVAGDIGGLSTLTSLTTMHLRTTSIGGDVGELAPLTLLVTLNCHTTTVGYNTATLPAWSGISISLQNNSMSATEVDNFLIDLAAAGGTNGMLNIAGTNAARSAASDAAKATLLANGWAITVNE